MYCADRAGQPAADPRGGGGEGAAPALHAAGPGHQAAARQPQQRQLREHRDPGPGQEAGQPQRAGLRRARQPCPGKQLAISVEVL